MKRFMMLGVLAVATTVGALGNTADAHGVRFGVGFGPSVGFYSGPSYGYRSYGRTYYGGYGYGTYGYGGGYTSPYYGYRGYSPYYGSGNYSSPYYGGFNGGSNYDGWCY